ARVKRKMPYLSKRHKKSRYNFVDNCMGGNNSNTSLVNTSQFTMSQDDDQIVSSQNVSGNDINSDKLD
ncbi:8871_t:CDS:1, partial [Funneliformis geosporum]